MRSNIFLVLMIAMIVTCLAVNVWAWVIYCEAILMQAPLTWIRKQTPLCFDGSNSWGQGGIMQWSIDFDDGGDAVGDLGFPPECPKSLVTHTYNDVDEYHPSLWVKDYENHTDTDTANLYVIDIDITVDEQYIAVNDDDDNENERMDFDDDEPTDNEDDLVEITISVESTKDSDKVRLQPDNVAYQDHVKIWTQSNRSDLVIPDDGKYYKEWSVGASGNWEKTFYVEGIDTSSLTPRLPIIINKYVGMWGIAEYPCVNGSPYVRPTILRVDMDMVGVKDDLEDTGTVTEEITPGGFIDLDDVVKLTLKKVAPTDLTGNVTLKCTSGSSKIRIWENEDKTGPVSLPVSYSTPSDLPKDLWVEGYLPSTSDRDITLVMEYPKGGRTFKDVILVTVVND